MYLEPKNTTLDILDSKKCKPLLCDNLFNVIFFPGVLRISFYRGSRAEKMNIYLDIKVSFKLRQKIILLSQPLGHKRTFNFLHGFNIKDY